MAVNAKVEYELEIERVRKSLKKLNIRRVLLQIPNGLKALSWSIIDEIEKDGIEVVLDSGHTWGLCDIPLQRAKLVNADCIVHYAHADVKDYFEINGIKVIMVPCYYKRNIPPKVLEELVRVLKPYKAIGLCSSIQHVKELLRVGNYLKDRGFDVYVGRAKTSIFKTGQITGCNVEASLTINDYVDAHVCISGGIFHAVGVAIATGKDVISLDPYGGIIEHSRIKKFLKRVLAKKLYNLMTAIEAEKFGIIISQKLGQCKVALALKIKKILERWGKKAVILVFDEIEPATIINVKGIDVFINTACPRLAIDELDSFEGITMINSGEVKYVISGNLENYNLKDALSWSINLNFLKLSN